MFILGCDGRKQPSPAKQHPGKCAASFPMAVLISPGIWIAAAFHGCSPGQGKSANCQSVDSPQLFGNSGSAKDGFGSAGFCWALFRRQTTLPLMIWQWNGWQPGIPASNAPRVAAAAWVSVFSPANAWCRVLFEAH
jgi:hypothetical protein